MKKALLCLITGLLSSPTFADARFVPAKLLTHNDSGPHSSALENTRREHWALVDYVVDEQGQPIHVLVEGSSPRMAHRAQSVLSQRAYEPARLDGKAIASSKQIPMHFNKAFRQFTNNNVSTVFAKYFDEAKRLVVSNQMTKAKPALDSLLEDHTKNLTEQAYTAWLLSAYYYNVQDWHQYEYHLREAVQLRKLLTPDMALMSTQSLMNLEVYKKQYGNALQTLVCMEQIKGKQLSKQTVREFQGQLQTQLADNPVITVSAKLTELRTWRHELNRSTISFSAENGSLSTVALYCQNGYQRFNELPVQNYQVPEAYGSCYLAVQGETDTQITYREEGDARFGLYL
ncbi:energy transducer TonB [Pseudoalteromonas sp. McH1-42]|uniref:energy transducer TonB n=1 Tax=Pseudoalteromonas sp. McH1-42 TaxID=2917752 RepID=UPI001EF41914|nr:energy transducer TonB [Pseudoalteromonas sp. McH1-42]MCG7562034.1 energy transducer TonB [Pseudoalteromonas sp. McH1-42]